MKVRRYPLTRGAAMQVAYAEATNPRFHELLGHAIEAERIPFDDAALVVSCAQEIARNNEVPCASTIAVIQQARLRVNAGKLTLEDLQKANDLLDQVEETGGIGDLDGLISTVAPAIKGVATMDVLEATIQAMGQKTDPAEAAEKFAAVANLGKARVSNGSELIMTATDIAAAAASTVTDPLPTGITELDGVLGGGIERSSLAVWLANSGDGKSLALCHVATESILLGYNVAYVTAELSEMQIKQRVYCNMFNMSAAEMSMQPMEAERRGQLLHQMAIREMEAGRATAGLGRLKVLYMTPKVGTISQIRQWIKELAKNTVNPFVPDVLLVDYADKLAAKAGDEAKGSYQSQGSIYQQLRDLIVDLPGQHGLGAWGWTASQTTGRQGRKKKLDIEDIADSMEKARICDTLVAIVRNDDDVINGHVRFRLPKRRNGQAHQEVGPLIMDPEKGRMVAMCREEPW